MVNYKQALRNFMRPKVCFSCIEKMSFTFTANNLSVKVGDFTQVTSS